MNEITILHYGDHPLEAVEIDGQKWLRVDHLVPPLGLGSRRAAMLIYERNQVEFALDETRLAVVQTDGGPQQVRVFSLRGVRLLAMLARTPQAAAFRQWVLDLLEGRVARRGVIKDVESRPLSPDQQQVVRALRRRIEDGHPVKAWADDLLSGRAGLEIDPALTHHADMREALSRESAALNRRYAQQRRAAALDGFSDEAIKAELRRRASSPQKHLDFAAEEPADA